MMLAVIAALLTCARSLFPLQSESIPAALLLFLPFVLFAALGAGRELLTPSLKGLAFFSFLAVAALAIWPSARLAVTAYEATGFVTLLGFMGFVFVMALALGLLAVRLLAGRDDEI